MMGFYSVANISKTEVAAQKCSLKKVFLEILQNLQGLWPTNVF